MPAPPGFDEYWLLFVRAHEHPLLRRAQLLATTAGISCLAVGLLGRRASLLLAAPVVGLVPPWVLGRVLSPEVDLPPDPLYRLLASLKMWGMTLAGTFEDELARASMMTPRPEGVAAEEPLHPPTNMVTDHTLH
jgi:hypothetical protein